MGLKFSRKSREALQDQGLVRKVSASAGAEYGRRRALAEAEESENVRDAFMDEVSRNCPNWRFDLTGTDFDMGDDCYIYTYAAHCGKGDVVNFAVSAQEGYPYATIAGISDTYSADNLVSYLHAFEKSSGGEAESKVQASCGEGELSEIYGDQEGYYTDGSSATGFYATKLDIIGFSVLHNDCATLRKLHDERITCLESELNAQDKLYNFNFSWRSDDIKPDDPEMIFDWEGQYDREFVKDWERIVGKENNEEALALLLEYEPEFTLCEVDFWNAFHKGYSKSLLSSLARNMVDVTGKDGFEQVYNCSYDELSAFLSSGSRAYSRVVRAAGYGSKVVNGFELWDWDDPTTEQYIEFGNKYLDSIGRDDLRFYRLNDENLRKALHWKHVDDLREMAEYFTDLARENSSFDPVADFFYMDGITMCTFMEDEFESNGPFFDSMRSYGFKEWLIAQGEIDTPPEEWRVTENGADPSSEDKT